MLDLMTIDRIFEEVWSDFTSREYTDEKVFVSRYMDRLINRTAQRTDRLLPRINEFIDPLKGYLSVDTQEENNEGATIVFPDQTFILDVKRRNRISLRAEQYICGRDITLLNPSEVALAMEAVGNYREKIGNRWEEYLVQLNETHRLREIFWRYSDQKLALGKRYAKALATEEDTTPIIEEFTRLLMDESNEKGTPLKDSERDSAIRSFMSDGQKKMKSILKRQEAAEKAKAKRQEEKGKDILRYERELNHLVATVGITPTITRRFPWSGHQFMEYRYPLSNGQTFSIRDYDKSPAQVEKVATTVMRELGMMIPYLASKYRTTADDWPSTPGMIRYYNQKAMDALGEESPFRPLIEAFEAPVNKVSFHVSVRFLSIQYYFKKGERQCLRFALPRDLEPEKVEGFMEHFKEFVRYDKALRRGGQILDYGFDVPEKK